MGGARARPLTNWIVVGLGLSLRQSHARTQTVSSSTCI